MLVVATLSCIVRSSGRDVSYIKDCAKEEEGEDDGEDEDEKGIPVDGVVLSSEEAASKRPRPP